MVAERTAPQMHAGWDSGGGRVAAQSKRVCLGNWPGEAVRAAGGMRGRAWWSKVRSWPWHGNKSAVELGPLAYLQGWLGGGAWEARLHVTLALVSLLPANGFLSAHSLGFGAFDIFAVLQRPCSWQSHQSTWLLHALALAAPVLSAVLPSGRDVDVHAEERPAPVLDLDLQQTYAQATFVVPCHDCLGNHDDDDSSLVLSFRTHSTEQPCGTSNITLNGNYLPQEWNGTLASGSGLFAGVADIEKNAWFSQHDLDLEWESACLYGNETDAENLDSNVAQVLTVTIKGIDGKALAEPSGFTISYKQLSPPELLRFEPVPNHSARNKAEAEDWRQPPASLRLVVPSAQDASKPTDTTALSTLDEDLRELQELQLQAQELHKAIHDKQKQINLQLNQESKSLAQELKQCHSVACVLRTIAHKAHGAWKVVLIHIHPKPNMGRLEDDIPPNRIYRPAGPKNPQANIHVESLPPRPTATRDAIPLPSGFTGEPISPSSMDDHRLPPPPPPPPPPPHGHGHGPHPFNHDPPHIVVMKALVGALFCGCLVVVIRNRCSSLRTKTDRAARREERRNARAYRRAACKLRWRRWWSGNWRDQERIDDYEEKRALIVEQESVLEEAMQEEIRQLRAAHGVVNSLVQAEEGRIQTQCLCQGASPYPGPPGPSSYVHTPTPYSPISSRASIYTSSSMAELPSRPLSRTNSLPDYHSEASSSPPAYESDEDVSDVVANGFSPRGYTPSTSSESTRWTPDSSVVDVSPRPSAETLRFHEVDLAESDGEDYAEITNTGVGDVKN
ncbi:hypothetical protein P154DRAFT_624815 [Amniculicola lignicola CBS 123094]|uniref:Uncharacterized protein n=1 Tax=Amniculicola lignicola CBS 123094 TaxID=1392246 RepID=A0A6A5W045_9PLEO|nr:hypothetical protein P154DRAFT_624815 [Amniculicola lignicola CBS 123094]